MMSTSLWQCYRGS